MFSLPYFLLENMKTGKYRKSLRYKFGLSFPQDLILKPFEKPPIWIHALSVGEVTSAVPLSNRIHQSFPEIPIVFSVTTETGYKIAVDRLSAITEHIIFYPLDLIWVVRRLIDTIRPRLFILVETDIWPNFLKVMSQYAPIILINGSISEKSYKRYQVIRWFTKGVFEDISFLGVQTEEDASRFIGIGANKNRVSITGNLKFDQPVVPSECHIRRLRKGLRLEKKRVLVAGSTHRGEDEIILRVYKSLKSRYPALRLIIAPRHPERFDEVENLAREYGLKVAKKTEIFPSTTEGFEVIILDTMGELRDIYGLASVVFVGGSLVNVGGHNLLEAAVHRKPVLFGPYTQDQFDIVRVLKSSGGGIEVINEHELRSQIEKLFDNPVLSRKLGEKAYEAIDKSRGVLDRTVGVIEKFLNSALKDNIQNPG